MLMNDIYLGSCYDLIKEIPDKSIDLIITDPPYDFHYGGSSTGIFKDRQDEQNLYKKIEEKKLNAGYDMSILNQYIRVMKTPNIYIWCNKAQLLDYLKFFVDNNGCNFEIIIWNKTNAIPLCANHYLSDKEYCIYFYKNMTNVHFTYQTAKTVYVDKINSQDKKKYYHPTIKPEYIINNLILNSSSENDVILDTFSGSGTTCVCAKRLNRRYIGFEIDEEYYKISKERLNEEYQESLF